MEKKNNTHGKRWSGSVRIDKYEQYRTKGNNKTNFNGKFEFHSLVFWMFSESLHVIFKQLEIHRVTITYVQVSPSTAVNIYQGRGWCDRETPRCVNAHLYAVKHLILYLNDFKILFPWIT